MGNCMDLGLREADEVIRVITSNGTIMEFSTAITAGSITDEFPGQAMFRSTDIFQEPLLHHERLLHGETYSLLPLNIKECTSGNNAADEISQQGHHHHHHVRSNSVPASLVVPYRMMTSDYQPTLRRSHTDVFSRYNNSNNHGVWKVKLVITKEQLLEILSQEAPTQELIESVRTVAKFGNGVPSTFAVRMLPHTQKLVPRNI